MKNLTIAILFCYSLVSPTSGVAYAAQTEVGSSSALPQIGTRAVVGERLFDEDLLKISGKLWRGQLSYLDYSANVLRSIPSNLLVTRSSEKSSVWLWSYGYDKEPHANASNGIELSEDGRRFGNENVLQRQVAEDGTLTVITSMVGEDDNRPAEFRFTYTVTENTFTRQKEVKLKSGGDFFTRHTYRWTR
ncbi:hypothetical protein [Undibacterium fentianense]|uniref:Uncharacterized protein n=1 Tax=Undibacterium fentianense TaxID=2828728 RepID=A0A941E5L3_9BURK|nr:hypothetical protein [Undibacterium fentianense]MBR7800143.1 hypothetical protein [Undibacterium fentianense]